MLGTFGMANDIYDQELNIYDSAEGESPDSSYTNNFDMDRIRYSPDIRAGQTSQPLTTDSLISNSDTLEIITKTQISYNGGTINDTSTYSEFNVATGNFGYDYAIAQYNVTDRQDELLVTTRPNNADYIYITAVNNGEPVYSVNAGQGSDNIDLSGSKYNASNVELVEFIMVDDTSTVSLSGNFEETGVTGLANSLIRFLSTSYDYIAEVPSLLLGYIAFTLAIPGTLGTFLRLYIGALLFVFVVLELWIG